MSPFLFDQDAYLQRINFRGSISDDFEFVRSIHRAQHTTIPFENFDICLGQGIDLDPDAQFKKLINNNRGGYCFELNGLFLSALHAFGFKARSLLGRVHLAGEPTGRGHLVSLVTIEGTEWLVDLGFGSHTPLIPIPFIYNETCSFAQNEYRLIKSDLFGTMLQSKVDGEWQNLYSFDLAHVCAGDIAYGNHYTSTSPNSFFTFSRVAVLPIENGMISLFNYDLKKMINGEEYVTQIEPGKPYLEMLRKEFGIALNSRYQDLKPL
jgi:N-hydroxyarylamine O-acetyltransferase